MEINQTNAHAAILRAGDGFAFGPAHKTRECAERGISPFEGAEILGFAELFPVPIMGMRFALQRHANETIAELRELERRGVRIQANRGTVDEPRWETLTEPAQFTCPAHLYRAHPDDLAASIPDEDPDEDSLVDGDGFEAIEVLQALAEKLRVPCTHAAIEDAIDDLVRDRQRTSDKLTFDAFRHANVSRCLKWHPTGIESWSPSEWATALMGELGELASLLKMRNRERDGLAGNKFSPTDKMIADELADVQTYLDLLAASLGVDLGRATATKFNEVSERVGFPDRIALGDQA